jgi:hypothetical protein
VASRDSGAKNPVFVAAGRTAARARWGPPRILRLDTLDPVTRDIVRAILTAQENAKAASANVTPEAAQEARRARDEHPTIVWRNPAPRQEARQ